MHGAGTTGADFNSDSDRDFAVSGLDAMGLNQVVQVTQNTCH